MADRVALYLQDAHPLADAIEYVQYAELCGFEAVWQAESRLVRDAIVPMAAFAAVTSRIKIGSGVINNWTRNAAVIAATFLTLDDLAEDRIYCGIGAWWDPLAAKGRHPAAQEPARHARGRHRGSAFAQSRARQLRWRIRPDARCRT